MNVIYLTLFTIVMIGFSGIAFADLNTGGSILAISTPYNSYVLGGNVYVRGDTNPNSNVAISVVSPSLELAQKFFTMSDDNGKINTSFFLPDNSEQGTWIINATNGVNFDTVEFDVVDLQQDRMMTIDIQGLRTYTDSIKTTNDLRITDFCQLYSFFEKGEFPNGDKLYLLSYNEVSKKYPNYKIDKTHYDEFLDVTKRFLHPYFERWHHDRYDGPTENIDWMYMKEWQIHPEMINLFERYMHRSDSKPSSCISPEETFVISHAAYDGMCAPGFVTDGQNLCSLDYSCGYPHPGKTCSSYDGNGNGYDDNQIDQNYLRPLKQERVGIQKDDTICISGKLLAFRTSNDSSVCVHPESIPKMVQRETIPMADFKNIIVQDSSLFEITIEDPIDKRGLVPILAKQITNNTAFYFGDILLWDFLTEDYGDWGPNDTRTSWDDLPGNYRFDYDDIIDDTGDNPVDWTRMPEDGFVIPALLHGTQVFCGDEKYRAVIHYGQPTTVPLLENTSTIISPSYAGGLLPDKDGNYRLSIASYFEQTVHLPENAVEISRNYEKCQMENLDFKKTGFHNNFANAYHHEVVFRIEG